MSRNPKKDVLVPLNMEEFHHRTDDMFRLDFGDFAFKVAGLVSRLRAEERALKLTPPPLDRSTHRMMRTSYREGSCSCGLWYFHSDHDFADEIAAALDTAYAAHLAEQEPIQ